MKSLNLLNNKEYCITSKELNKIFYFMSEAKDKQFFKRIASNINNKFWFMSLSFISNIKFSKNDNIIIVYFGDSLIFKTQLSFLEICKLTYVHRKYREVIKENDESIY